MKVIKFIEAIILTLRNIKIEYKDAKILMKDENLNLYNQSKSI